MSGFVFHPAALTDIDEIWKYIAADSASAADRVLDEIQEAISHSGSPPSLWAQAPRSDFAPVPFSSSAGPSHRVCTG